MTLLEALTNLYDDDAQAELDRMIYDVQGGEDPDFILDAIGLEPDYVLELIELSQY